MKKPKTKKKGMDKPPRDKMMKREKVVTK